MNPNRKPVIAGNWKMYKTAAEGVALVNQLKPLVADVTTAECVVCPTFTALAAVGAAVEGSNVILGAQNVHWETEGAFTGEIAAAMLTELAVQYAIIGHSERRQYFHETNETVNHRTRTALAGGLRPIVCVGETLEQREGHMTEHIVSDQVMAGLAGLTKNDMLQTVVAYEPVWAIGTGQTATPAQAQDVHRLIRDILERMFDSATAEQVRIQYGGSVKPANAADLLGQPDIDGALVGGASLAAESFAEIVRAAQ